MNSQLSTTDAINNITTEQHSTEFWNEIRQLLVILKVKSETIGNFQLFIVDLSLLIFYCYTYLL